MTGRSEHPAGVLVAVLADTHLPRGSRQLPETCVMRLARADLILHAGDLVSLAFLDELATLGPPVQVVAGNMDEPALKRMLPSERVVQAAGTRIGMIHSGGRAVDREARLVQRFPDCAAIVYGHTHLPQVERWHGVWILNPGSPTERRRAPSRTMLEVRLLPGRLLPTLIDVGE